MSASPVSSAVEVAFLQDERTYRANEAISQSEMKELLNSPAHFMSRYGPDAEPFIASPAMKLGTAIHHRALEPETFSKHYVSKGESNAEPTIPELKEMAKEQEIDIKGKSKKADLLAAVFPDGIPKEKRNVLSEKDWLICHGAADALRSHEVTGDWFSPGLPGFRRTNEVSIYATDHLGLRRKCRIDRLHMDVEEGRISIVDLKTTEDCSIAGFTRSILNYKYHLQAFWYSDLVRRAIEAEALPRMDVDFYFVAVERKRPFAINVFHASQEVLSEGAKLAEKAVHTLSQCRELDFWPGLDPVIHELNLPSWGKIQDDELEF